MESSEEVLNGGNVANVVVRVGVTVCKPATSATPAVEALLKHLLAAGFPAAPQALGLDERGRHVLEYVPGQRADTLSPLTDDELHRLGGLIRQLHDTTSTFVPPPDARWQVIIPPDRQDLVVHHDLAPWNLIRDGDRWVFIDWDNAGPGSRLWDLAYAVVTFACLWADQDPVAAAARLRALVAGYQPDSQQRSALPAMLATRTRAMYDLLLRGHVSGRQPWAQLYAAGHGRPWLQATHFLEQHEQLWAEALHVS